MIKLAVRSGLAVGFLGVVLLVSACGGKETSPTATTKNAVLSLDEIGEIQPGLGTVMIEYGTRMNNLWFAAQKGNWDMVKYQIDEMLEIQEVAEKTRPKRAPMLKAFEKKFLARLGKAAEAKQLSGFTTAYDEAVGGCNACHAGSLSKDKKSNYSFVKITRPKAPDSNNVDWAGQKLK